LKTLSFGALLILSLRAIIAGWSLNCKMVNIFLPVSFSIMLKAVIFDMDGVLLDSEPYHYFIEGEIYKSLGINIPEEIRVNFVGLGNKEMWTFIKNKYGEEKMLINIENVGNTGASSAPLCLFDFKEKGMFKNGDKILMCSFGAGYTIGIVEVEFID